MNSDAPKPANWDGFFAVLADTELPDDFWARLNAPGVCAAAAAVASAVASQHVASISQAVGRLQGHMESIGRLPAPPKQDP